MSGDISLAFARQADDSCRGLFGRVLHPAQPDLTARIIPCPHRVHQPDRPAEPRLVGVIAKKTQKTLASRKNRQYCLYPIMAIQRQPMFQPIVNLPPAADTSHHRAVAVPAAAECRFAVQEIAPLLVDASRPWLEMLMRPPAAANGATPECLVRALYRRHGIEALDRGVIGVGIEWLSRQPGQLRCSVNVHPDTLVGEGFCDWMIALLRRHQVSPRQLSLEIIEFADTVKLAEFRRPLQSIRNAGVTIALDDYGNGSSNLALLAEGCVDFVKVDRSIIDRIDCNQAYARLVGNICRMCTDQGVGVVAEGVEREAQVSALRGFGVAWAQGYFYSRPRLIEA